MQQRAGRLFGHAAITVGSSGADVLLQAQHAAHARFLLDGPHEVELGGARVGEENVDAFGQKRLQKGAGAGGRCIDHFGKFISMR